MRKPTKYPFPVNNWFYICCFKQGCITHYTGYYHFARLGLKSKLERLQGLKVVPVIWPKLDRFPLCLNKKIII